jgi:hypothetical protein
MGGNFLIGDKLQFTVRTSKVAKVLLINTDSFGKVSILYPFRANELESVAAGKALVIGAGSNDAINVTEPLGMDVQLLLAFDEPGPNLSRWTSKTNLPADEPQLADVERMLTEFNGRFTYTRTELRVLPKF